MLKMKDNNYINNIATIRKKKGISQTQFANAIGVETSTISSVYKLQANKSCKRFGNAAGAGI